MVRRHLYDPKSFFPNVSYLQPGTLGTENSTRPGSIQGVSNQCLNRLGNEPPTPTLSTPFLLPSSCEYFYMYGVYGFTPRNVLHKRILLYFNKDCSIKFAIIYHISVLQLTSSLLLLVKLAYCLCINFAQDAFQRIYCCILK